MKKINNNKAITLIALVITIIVLLILAGITVAQLSGNNLFENAKLAKEKYQQAREQEDEILGDYEDSITGDRGNKVNYSTEEQVVGSWIDGTALYQRTFSGNVTANTWSVIVSYEDLQNMSISLSNIMDIKGIIHQTNGNTNPILGYRNSSTCGFISADTDGLEIFYTFGGTAYVTIQYTKTTD